ncbi:MAG: glycosyltransferase family 4 protein [Candidatus Omnitrophica bacterium]|nr:glycosyltransferase family 4 protein [Candidatus Omnitrophota bacterium]
MKVAFDVTALVIYYFTGVQRYVVELLAEYKRVPEVESLKLFYNSVKFPNFSDLNFRELSQAGLPKPTKIRGPLYFDQKNFGEKYPPFLAKNASLSVSAYNRFVRSQAVLGYLRGRYRKFFKETQLVHFPYHCAPEQLRQFTGIFPDCPRVATIHDIVPVLFPEQFKPLQVKSFTEAIQATVEGCHGFITASESSKKDFVRHFSVPENKMFVIHHAVNPSFYPIPEPKCQKILETWQLKYKSYFLSLSPEDPRKNVPRILAAYLKFAGGAQDVPKMVVMGRLKNKKGTVIDSYKPFLNDPRIVFLGEMDSNLVPYLFNGAVALVFPSLYEGFGLPVLEAMQSGTPVISSREGSLAEIGGDAAYFVDPYQVSSLEEAMRRIFEDKGLCEVLSRKGLEYAGNFSWEKTASETLDVYRKFI